MIDKVFVFGDKDAADVMVARPDVVALSVALPPQEALETVLDSPYTRYPVYRETLDDIVGVLHVRDLFSAVVGRSAGSAPSGSTSCCAPPTSSRRRRTSARSSRSSGARTTTSPSSSTSTARWSASARSRICSRRSSARSRTSSTCRRSRSSRSTTTRTGSTACSRSTSSTSDSAPTSPTRTTTPIAGFVFGQLGRAPEPGDDVAYNGLRFDVLEVEGNRIERVAVTFIERPRVRHAPEDLLLDDDEVE